MQTNNPFLQFLEVGNVMKTLKDIILELLFKAFLFIELFSQVCDFIGQAFLAHTKIIDNKSQVLIHTVKVL